MARQVRKQWRMAGPLGMAAVATLLLLAQPLGAEKIKDLKPQGYVNDFAGVLSAPVRAQLEALCAEVDQKTHAQIAVVTIHSLGGRTAEQFGHRLFDVWGVGHKKHDRGVLILLAINDHKYWTEVGYGLEPVLTDAEAGRLGREMIPKLRAGDYDGAVSQMTAQVAEAIAQSRGVKLSVPSAASPLPAENSQPANTGGGALGLIMLMLIAYLVFRTGGWWLLPMFLGGGFGGGGFGGGGFGGGGGGFGGFGGGISGGGGAGGGW
jgi:uncharacterized protein